MQIFIVVGSYCDYEGTYRHNVGVYAEKQDAEAVAEALDTYSQLGEFEMLDRITDIEGHRQQLLEAMNDIVPDYSAVNEEHGRCFNWGTSYYVEEFKVCE